MGTVDPATVSATIAALVSGEAKARAPQIEQMKFTIAKLRHERFGQSSERGALLEQLELQLADMEEDASEADTVHLFSAGRAQTGCPGSPRPH